MGPVDSSQRRCTCWLLLALVVAGGSACREENPGFGETLGSSSTGTTSTGTTSTTTDDPSATTSSTTEGSSTTGTTSTTSTTDDTGTGTGVATSSGTGTGTGGAPDCAQFDSPPACNGAGGCLWWGGGGMCLPTDPAACPDLDEAQCGGAGQCTYDADAMVCMAS